MGSRSLERNLKEWGTLTPLTGGLERQRQNLVYVFERQSPTAWWKTKETGFLSKRDWKFSYLRRQSLSQTLSHTSAWASVTRWRFVHSFINFSQQWGCLEGSSFRWKMYLCLPHNLWKYELVWTSRMKIITKIDDVTRWWSRDKKLRVTWLFFIFLRMFAVLKGTFYRRFVADSLRYPTDKKDFQAGVLFWRVIGFINVTRWRSRNAMTMTFFNRFFYALFCYIYTSAKTRYYFYSKD